MAFTSYLDYINILDNYKFFMIKDKISEIQEYFKQKIRNWEYQIEKSNHVNQIDLKIDWEYFFQFSIFEHLGSKKILQYTDVWDKNYLKLDLNEKEKEDFYKLFYKVWIIENRKEKIRAEKLDLYEQLKKELNIS